MWTRIAQSLTEVANRPISQFWLDAALKATVLLLAAIGATALLRRQSAALRHRLWCLTFAALVMLPGLSAALPKWRLAVLPYTSPLATREGSQSPPPPEATVAADPEFAADSLAAQDGLPLAEREDDGTLPSDAQRRILPIIAPAMPRVRLRLITMWLGGALLTVSPLVIGLLRTLLLRRKARAIDDASWSILLEELRGRLRLARRVELIETEAAVMPMTWGLRRPVVLLPRQAREWPDRLRRIVLLHELAHIKRCDVAFQTLGRLACALYWFHPLAWYALRRLRIERELACDDCVVHTGERASDYAAELLQVARTYRPIRFAAAVAMAQRSNLEHRLLALFDRARSHLPLSARGARLLMAGMLVLATTIAVIRLAPRAAAGDDAPAVTPDNISLESDEDLVTVSGRVVDPKGKPVAGAKIFAVRWYWDSSIPHAPLAETKSDAQGRFSIAFRKSQFDVDVQQADQWKNTQIVARAAGFGPQWVTWRELVPGQDATLRLATDDVPIEGRVVDLEGRPIAGVQVRTSRIDAAINENLDAWLAAISRGELPDTAFSQMRDMLQTFEGWSPQTSTDRDGHFELHGLGRERAVHLALIDPTVAYGSPIVVTRRMDPIQRRESRTTDKSETIYGARCLLVAPPTQPISGVIRDASSHEPLAGVTVVSTRLGGVWDSYRTVRAVTDKAGRYRLTGMPKGKENEVIVVPNDDQPYFMREMEVPETDGLDPIALDIDLPRGIWISGHISDLSTGQPVIARLHYFPFLSNEFAQAAFGSSGNVYGSGFQNRYSSRADGSYRLVGLPGRAIVGVASILRPYCAGVGADHIAGLNNRGTFDTYRNALAPGKKWPHTLKEINPPPGVESFHCDLSLDPGASRIVEVVDPDGKPLVGFEIEGRTAYYEPSSPPAQKSSVEIVNLGVDETRTVLIRHKERKLAKIMRVRRNDHPERPLTVTVERSARVIGRLIDENGEPIAGAAIEARVRPSGDFTKHLAPVASDGQGRFDYAGIPTGCDYDLIVEAAGISYASVADDLRLIPGEAKDLGDVIIGGEKKSAQPASNNESRSTPAADASDAQIVTLRGRVLDPDDKPLAGAKLYLSYANQDARKPRLLGAAGDDGRFQFEVDNAEVGESLAPDPRVGVNIAAVAEGFGLQWLDLDQRDDNGEYTLRLVNDVPIHGRIVDVDGQGIAGAKLRLRKIAVPANGLDGYIEATRNGSFFSFDRTRDSLPGTPVEITLDPDGRFTLRGVSAERVVEILVEGPNIEWWYIKVMSRKTDAVPVGHGVPGTPVMPRPDRVYGAEFGHVAPPSRLIVGTLRDGESGKPIAGVTVQSRGLYSSMHLPKTDAEGRFELLGHPKAPQYELLAVPDGLPYFEGSVKVQDTPGLEPLSVEMTLLRGTEARGRMTFAPDGQPGPGTVEYHPLRPNPDAVKIVPRAVQRPLATATIGADGRYRLPVLPGPGVLAFRAHGLRRLLYAPAYVGRDELENFFHDGQDHGDERVLQRETGRPGPAPIFQTNYNRLILINPPRGAELLETDVTIESGRTAKGMVYDPDDQPLAGAMTSGLGGRQGIGDVRLDTPAFTVAAMHPRRTRELVFRHPDKRWGKFLIVPGDQVDVLHVRLERCGEAEGRLLDAEGMPLAHASISVSRHQHAPTMTVETNDRGIFRIDNLIPGLKYDLNLLRPAQRLGQPRAIQTEIVVAAGERKALGDVGVKARQAIPSKAAGR